MSRRLVGLLVVSTAAAVLGCDWFPGRPTPEERPVLPSEVKDFATLFGDNCAGCHGADGRMGAARPMNDPLYYAAVTDDELRTVITSGVPDTAMPAFGLSEGGTLTADQITALIDEMRKRWGTPLDGVKPPPYRSTGNGDVARGEVAYEKFCARCHGEGGRGGEGRGSIVDSSYLALVSDQALRSTVIFGRIDLGMPDWREDVPGEPMSPRDIGDVVAWLASQRAKFPGQPYPQGGETNGAR